MDFNITDKFNIELPADPNKTNSRRQIFESCYSYVTPRIPSNPKLIHVAQEMANTLGLSEKNTSSREFLEVFTGSRVLDKTSPYAMCYGGHQFGNWAGQLGDGRAINLFEITAANKSWALQLKGAGETPYSRTADGLAVLRSSIREHLCSEAMHYLRVPTTRSLSLCLTGDKVLRDVMYDGNSAYEKGAVVCRVSPSFVRFGNFQIFASRGDKTNLKKLTDYTIKHFYPGIEIGTKEGYLQFFEEVMKRTFAMIIEWQRVGFVHGVMNTDNMSILGLTIDYGPYGWLEGYDRDWTPNTTDREHRRYRFGNQPPVAHWNLYQLANALYPLIEEAAPLEKILKTYQIEFIDTRLAMMRSKLGLTKADEQDATFMEALEETLELTETDMTIFYRELAKINKNAHPEDVMTIIHGAFYSPKELEGDVLKQWHQWIETYLLRLNIEDISDHKRAAMMNEVNPKYVLRNYMAQLAIDAADNGDYSVIEELYQLLKFPYAEQNDQKKWYAKRPEWARTKIGCSMLSCSS